MVRTRTTSRALALIALTCALSVLIPGSAVALRRSEVLSRAQVWVAARVPYSQKGYATVEGSLVPTGTVKPDTLGYRTDCSGFVSMCLNLRTPKGAPLSYATATLDDILVKIPKSSLRPGDVILRPSNVPVDGKTVYGHAVVFGGWTDSSQTAYVGYHESGSSKGTVRAVINWGTSGFWSEKGFGAYHCPSVRDRAKLDVVVSQ